jgi:hypothetical protein
MVYKPLSDHKDRRNQMYHLTAGGESSPEQRHVEGPPVDHAVAAGRDVRALHRVRVAVLPCNTYFVQRTSNVGTYLDGYYQKTCYVYLCIIIVAI